MKTLVLLTSLILTSPVFAKGTDDLFTQKQTDEVLRTIDNVCGDTWCEGDYNFDFTGFSCKKSTQSCLLEFHFIQIDDNDQEQYSPKQTCQFEQIKEIGQLLEDDGELNWNFYEEVTDCITELESSVEF